MFNIDVLPIFFELACVSKMKGEKFNIKTGGKNSLQISSRNDVLCI
jgi:hypothetical protein